MRGSGVRKLTWKKKKKTTFSFFRSTRDDGMKLLLLSEIPSAQEGIKIPNKSSELNELLGLLMEQLEGMKASAGLAGAEEDELYMENFALKIFAKADKYVPTFLRWRDFFF